MSRNQQVFLCSVFLVLSTIAASADEDNEHSFTQADQENHARLVQQLSSDQSKVLSDIYPGFRVLTLCSGHFSGVDKAEPVLGIWKPVKSNQKWKREVHRVGLIWTGKAWEAHIIDDEIEKDAHLSNSFPMLWQYKFTKNGFVGEMKCGIESEFKEGSDISYEMGDRPFFDLKAEGLLRNKPVCYATDDVYNNWDCVVYSPKDGRFKLWFQQAHAD